MKTKVLIFMAGLLLIGMGAFAMGKKTEKVDVSGNCEMCKARIEKAARGVDGVFDAVWDQKAKVLKVTYDEKKTGIESVQKAVVAVGHDSGKLKAENKVYNALPGCCKYRK
jgi:periplasmic mercuric ion binding protein